MRVFYRLLSILILLGVLRVMVLIARTISSVSFDFSYFKTSEGIKVLLAWAFIMLAGPILIVYLWRRSFRK
jgi:hypothetical protein